MAPPCWLAALGGLLLRGWLRSNLHRSYPLTEAESRSESKCP
ncbi:MAG: hypothetical protein ACRDTE_09780 [Pseudonocardiaceae bacterium]